MKTVVNGASQIIVTYKAKVVSEAYETPDNLKNAAYLKYNSASYNTQGVEKKINVDRQLYTYGVKIKKVDNKDENTALQGAEFALKKGDTEIKFAKSGKMYYPAADGDAKLTTDGNGEMLIAGLDLGTYTLTETKAPSGYTLPRNPETTITLSEKDAVNGTLDESKAEGTNVKANSASVDTQKTWQLNFVLTNGKRHRNGSLYDRRNYDHGRSGNASYICDPQKQKIGSFRKKRKKFRTENRQRKGRKTNRERKRQKG